MSTVFPRKESAVSKDRRLEMRRQIEWFTLFLVLPLALMFAGCTPQTGGIGPQGPVGAQPRPNGINRDQRPVK